MNTYNTSPSKNFLLTLLLSIFLLGLMGAMPNVFAAKGLSPDEAKTLLTDKTVESVGARGFSSITFFSSDGIYSKSNRGELIKGQWHIDDEGQLCQRPEGESTASCHLIVKKGNVWKLYKIPSKVTMPWKHKRTFNKILDGNPNNL
ncbi:MAG: hypothetical protein KZQ64_08495 [gamma proteobacterium symbiont of Bathyaustriella thionipta]|nr:hypothetical protein [gamma proteobacterium symbiont of Bathyaustriella thionipta]MCU7951108.1 hypothetical protein [gamma proteobacterium symbiont of Bathyaustriella thionipta]MCU7953412.1 hypothetical protein [gamma proteobacterium symbiont of Bathyaustriella thionipta]MCU7957619.1 hypothetical protein [gamma proteobacterium symbiont of Bathyaustriella thionipta]MCU7966737.1 hypothetical protein [gamma proteobacterium symbiont of Bathyaustriella thionipta]